MMMTINKLTTLLKNTPAGRIPAEKRTEVLRLLVRCWTEFSGSTDSKMAAWKVGREAGAEDMTWKPPVLTFITDRHGGTVLGSTRAEKQQWTLNLEKKTADHCNIGYRQLAPTAPPLDVKAIAAEVFQAVQQGPDSDAELILEGILVFKDDQIILSHGKLIRNNGVSWTISGRRKRFRAELTSLMATIGWELVSVRRVLTFTRCIGQGIER